MCDRCAAFALTGQLTLESKIHDSFLCCLIIVIRSDVVKRFSLNVIGAQEVMLLAPWPASGSSALEHRAPETWV